MVAVVVVIGVVATAAVVTAAFQHHTQARLASKVGNEWHRHSARFIRLLVDFLTLKVFAIAVSTSALARRTRCCSRSGVAKQKKQAAQRQLWYIILCDGIQKKGGWPQTHRLQLLPTHHKRVQERTNCPPRRVTERQNTNMHIHMQYCKFTV